MNSLDVTQIPRGEKQTGWLDVAPRPEGSLWRLPYLFVAGESDGPTLVVTAGVHGDEYEGIEAIPRIHRSTQPADLSGTLVMVPVCNVPAFEAITRNSPIDGLNLARVFPGDASGSITQRIADVIATNLLPHADYYIDLHSGGMMYDIPTLAGYIHDDSEIGRRSRAGAEAFGAPVLWGHPLPLAPGRTISSAAEQGVPCLYTEATGGGYAREEDVISFEQGVNNIMKWMDMLEGSAPSSQPAHHLVGNGNIDQAILAPSAGMFRPEVQLLEEVSEGQLLGTIQDLFGEMVDEIRATASGVVIMLRRFHRVRAGDGLAHITQRLAG